jgi:hypothetical protein
MLFIPHIMTKFLTYKTTVCKSNIHSNSASCLFLHVAVEIHQLLGAYTPVFKTH